MECTFTLPSLFEAPRWQRLASPLFVGLSLLLTCQAGHAQTNALGIPASEFSALAALYASTAGASWANNSGWTNAQAASWYGVTVTGGHVTHLDLDDNQLSGNVPDFTAFTNVSINITFNYLTIATGSQSLATINAMIAAGNTVYYSPQTAAPTLGPILFLSGSGSQVGLTGLPGQYTIEASTDLVNWAPLGRITLTSGGGQYLDASATNYSRRFYRTVNPQ